MQVKALCDYWIHDIKESSKLTATFELTNFTEFKAGIRLFITLFLRKNKPVQKWRGTREEAISLSNPKSNKNTKCYFIPKKFHINLLWA